MMNSIRECIKNMFAFKNPSFEYDKINLLSKNIIYIDRGGDADDIKNYIPCLFIPELQNFWYSFMEIEMIFSVQNYFVNIFPKNLK